MRVKSPLTMANLLLLLVYPAAWLAPLAKAGLLPYFGGSEITAGELVASANQLVHGLRAHARERLAEQPAAAADVEDADRAGAPRWRGCPAPGPPRSGRDARSALPAPRAA